MTRPLYMVLKVNFAGTVPVLRVSHVHPNRDLLLSLAIHSQNKAKGNAKAMNPCDMNSPTVDKDMLLAKLRQTDYTNTMLGTNNYSPTWLYFVEEVPRGQSLPSAYPLE